MTNHCRPILFLCTDTTLNVASSDFQNLCFRSEYSGEVNSWSLYDAFMAFEQAEKEREMAGEQGEEAVTTEISEEERQRGMEARMLRSATIMERMLNLNTFHEIAEDFRYYEDPSDELKVDIS